MSILRMQFQLLLLLVLVSVLVLLLQLPILIAPLRFSVGHLWRHGVAPMLVQVAVAVPTRAPRRLSTADPFVPLQCR